MNKIGVISGYFSPIHAGHVEYINAAKKECDLLIAIVNNDKQVKLKKSQPFMDEQHRRIIVDNLKSVFMTVISIDEDLTVCKTLAFIKTMFVPGDISLIFFNSGDRDLSNQNVAEKDVCKKLGIQMKFLDLPKIYSSSELIKGVQK